MSRPEIAVHKTISNDNRKEKSETHFGFQTKATKTAGRCNKKTETIKEKLDLFKPGKAIAVGGDGTVKLVTECLIRTNIPLGILPAGSANGLARELGISNDPLFALDTLAKGFTKKMHVTIINDQLCIHLADIDLNAYAMKIFEKQNWRGMWGYLWAY